MPKCGIRRSTKPKETWSAADYGNHSWKKRLWQYKANCKKYNRIWSLIDDYAKFLFESDCVYCGREPSEYDLNGIDRIDSEQGYNENNCVPCCRNCNEEKGRRDFILIIKTKKDVYDHFSDLAPYLFMNKSLN